MTIELLPGQHLEFLSLKKAAQACLSLHLSKCHIIGNHMSRLNYVQGRLLPHVHMLVGDMRIQHFLVKSTCFAHEYS